MGLFSYKIVREGRPLLREDLAETANPLQKCRFSINIRLQCLRPRP